MLPYTLEQTLVQKAVIERDEAAVDKWGAESKAERKVIATVPCVLAPWVEASRARTEQTAVPVRTLTSTPVLLIVEAGVDVATRDWIKEILDANEDLLMDGPFRVVGAVPYETHMELSLETP